MTDFKIRRGLSTVLFSEPGKINPKLNIEEACWYLCTDTAELFLGVNVNGTLTLKKINEKNISDFNVPTKLSDLINDCGFFTKSDADKAIKEAIEALNIPEVPTKLSELENDAGYLTEHQDLTDYAKKSDIPDVSKFITEIPSEFITETELDNKGYLTEHQDLSDYVTKEHNSAYNRSVKYEVLPHDGMLVDYRGNEIRVNTQRVVPTEQQPGPTATPNQYYIQFRAYAPENAAFYKEWQGDKRDETLHTFDESFSGTDQFGRNYSLIWMSIANYANGVWSLYGDKSTIDKYLGFYYTFEWFNIDGKLIDTNKVRIILTNDACHNDLIPDAIARRIDEKIAQAQLDGAEVDLSNYATKSDLEGLATEDYVDDAIVDTIEMLVLHGGNASTLYEQNY